MPMPALTAAAARPAIGNNWRLLPRAICGHFGNASRVLWMLIGIATIICVAGCVALGITVVPGSLFRQIGIILLVLVVGGWYALLGRAPALADLANAVGTLLVVTAIGGTLSYLGMALAFSYVDPWLVAADSWIGFDWLAFNRWLNSMGWLELGVGLLYASSAPQVLAMVLLLSFTRRRERLAELVGLLTLAAVTCVAIGTFTPALGAHVTYAVPDHGRASYISDLEAVRSGALRTLEFSKMTGLVTFPSLHTAISLIIIWVARDWRLMQAVALSLNVPLLVGVPVFGSHYLVDMLGGVLITILAVQLWRYVVVAGVEPIVTHH